MPLARRVRGVGIYMTTRFYYIACAFVIIGLVVIAWFCLFHERPDPTMSFEELAEYIEKNRPFISDFLGLSFPGQHAPMMGIDNVRQTPYHLTEGDRMRAVKKLQDTFQETQKVSVTFHERWKELPVKESLLSYDQYLAVELCTQADLIQQTYIPPMNIRGTGPAIVFTLHPSGIKFHVMPCGDAHYVTLANSNPQLEHSMRWEGDMHHLKTAFLDARLQDGETVHSTASRVLEREWDW